MEIGTYLNKFVNSEYSGNLVDLCPVGALTSNIHKYRSRHWELKKTKIIVYARIDAISNIEKNSFILKPTPFDLPNSSTIKTIFQIKANPDLAAETKYGYSWGKIISLIIFIKYLNQNNIKVQFGHTLADYDCCKKYMDQFNVGFTHLYNAMSGNDHRNPGVLSAALQNSH